MNHFTIQDEKDYTFEEVSRKVSRVLSAMSDIQNQVGSDRIDLSFPARDVYFMIFDLVGYVSDRLPGELRLIQTRKGSYRIVYTTTSDSKTGLEKQTLAGLVSTAKQVYDQTGEFPLFALNKPEVMAELKKKIGVGDEKKS